MNDSIYIDSKMHLVGQQLPDFSANEIKNEPMLFNCDREHAKKLGGPITRAILECLPTTWRPEDLPLVIDSRVHMLMPGWFPCIPGWHHDDVPRTRPDGQPNYSLDQDRSEHLMVLINGEIAPTAFALGAAKFKEPELGDTVYRRWHLSVEELLKEKRLFLTSAPSRRFIFFDDRTWHTGSRAVANGWRYFIRISRYFDKHGQAIARRNERTNELRRQVQVYMDDLYAGW